MIITITFDLDEAGFREDDGTIDTFEVRQWMCGEVADVVREVIKDPAHKEQTLRRDVRRTNVGTVSAETDEQPDMVCPICGRHEDCPSRVYGHDRKRPGLPIYICDDCDDEEDIRTCPVCHARVMAQAIADAGTCPLCGFVEKENEGSSWV